MSETRGPVTEDAVSDDSQQAEPSALDPAAAADPGSAPDLDPASEPDSAADLDSAADGDGAAGADETGDGRTAAAPPGVEARGDAGSGSDWFLRTGRAGLLPGSITESSPEGGPATPRRAIAGAPPWASDQAGLASEAAPPWESGPWPEPGAEAGTARRREAGPGRPSAPTGQPVAPVAPVASASPAAADTGNWQASAAVVAGLVPAVVPGLVLGVLGLRRARVTGTGRSGSWLAITVSLIWAVVIAVWLASAGGTAASPCGNYQNVVGYPVSQVLHDLATSAPAGVLSSDLQKAISQANSAAASAQQVTARNAMATLTTSLQQIAAETASTPDAVRRQQVEAAAAAMTSACKA